MEVRGHQRNCIHLRLGHFHPGRVLGVVEFGSHPQARRRSRVADAVDDGLASRQGRPAPVRRDMAGEPVLDLVPLARPGWEVAPLDRETNLGREPLRLAFPDAGPTPVAPAGVGRDAQVGGVRVGAASHTFSPVPDRGGREGRRVVVASHAHPGFAASHVVDPVRNGPALRVARKVAHPHRRRRPLGCHSRPAFAKFTTSSFFFVSTEITGCPAASISSARALTCSNCAFRSWSTVPSCRLRTHCSR